MSVDGEELQAALAVTAAEHGPGVYGLVTEAGQPVFTGAVGVADLDSPRPIEACDRYRIGSVTKVYVATLVLQLVADALLALDDTVEKLLPDLVPAGADITVETLLRLRSGLPDYTTALFGDPPSDLSALERYWSPRQLVAAALASGDRLPPDREYRYNSTDYILLGMMIEKATGERVDAQMWQRIIKPLNLANTTFPTVDPYLPTAHMSALFGSVSDVDGIAATPVAIVGAAKDIMGYPAGTHMNGNHGLDVVARLLPDSNHGSEVELLVLAVLLALVVALHPPRLAWGGHMSAGY
jgi:D-alanyl-D-alanine carboxypeptidase